METFDSTKSGLYEILKQVDNGKIQLPDFQRGWIWDDYRIKGLLASIAKSFPIGAIMLLETGNPEVKFKTRPVEGADNTTVEKPERLILDGQQRITSLFQAIITNKIVKTKNEKGYEIHRWYYIDMEKALDGNIDIEEAIISINDKKQVTEDFGRKIILDLSKKENEYQNLMYPIYLIDEYQGWRTEFNKYWNYNADKIKFWDEFEMKVISNFNNYMLPVINMKKENSKDAICQVFEKVNTGGVSLNVFELLTATYAADEYDLRSDWDKRKERLNKFKVLTKTSSTDFIQAVTLLSTYIRREKLKAENKSDEQLPAVNCKRKDILNLTLGSFKDLADRVEKGFINAAKLLLENYIYHSHDLPYTTQLIPLSCIFAALDNKPIDVTAKEKIMKWYWCGVLGELYGGANETRYALDLPQVIKYLKDDSEPKTIYDAHFNPSRLHTLRTRNSAAYKGIYALLMNDGAKDFVTGTKSDINSYFLESIDIHHIFPKDWCIKNGILKDDYDCIINKTPLSSRTNRIVGGKAPSIYLEKLKETYKISNEKMDELIQTHVVNPVDLYTDNFFSFLENRKKELLLRIENAMGKSVENGENEENNFLGNGEEEE